MVAVLHDSAPFVLRGETPSVASPPREDEYSPDPPSSCRVLLLPLCSKFMPVREEKRLVALKRRPDRAGCSRLAEVPEALCAASEQLYHTTGCTTYEWANIWCSLSNRGAHLKRAL